MADFNEDMSKILGIYRCDRFIELLEDIYELVLLYNVDESTDWVADVVGGSDVRDVRLARTAYLLSKLAHRHGALLKKVSRVAPGFFQRAEKLTRPLALMEDIGLVGAIEDSKVTSENYKEYIAQEFSEKLDCSYGKK